MTHEENPYAIAKVDNTPPEAYNPAGMFKFHQVRIAKSMTDLSDVQTVVCRDFVVNNSTVTMYSIHKPQMFNAYRMGLMKDLPFGSEVLTLRCTDHRYESSYVVRSEQHNMNCEIDGYTLLESKTINVNRLDDAESHSYDPSGDKDNVWYKIDKERAEELFAKRRLVFEANITRENEKFVEESNLQQVYDVFFNKEIRKYTNKVQYENETLTKKAEENYKKAMEEYKAKWKIVRLFTPVPEKIEPELIKIERPTELSKDRCNSIRRFIEEFNNKHGNLLDMTHVYEIFGRGDN